MEKALETLIIFFKLWLHLKMFASPNVQIFYIISLITGISLSIREFGLPIIKSRNFRWSVLVTLISEYKYCLLILLFEFIYFDCCSKFLTLLLKSFLSHKCQFIPLADYLFKRTINTINVFSRVLSFLIQKLVLGYCSL